MALTYYVETFGCQMNVRDSETISALMEREGFRPAPLEEADVIIANTCAVRQAAERKAWSFLEQAYGSRRKKGDKPIVVLAGCMAQVPNNIKRIMEKDKFVSVATGPGSLHKIPQYILEIIKNKAQGEEPAPIVDVMPQRTGSVERSAISQALPEGLPRARVPGVSAFVNIIFGCDNFCSYCIVPFTRGTQVSRKPEDILAEVRELAGLGYKEVTLLGQNVNAYGRDFTGELAGYGFADLLSAVNEVAGIQRIRYATSHPRDFSFDMVDRIARLDKVCEHFHLPVQSGSNRILKLMNRGYTRETFLALVEKIRATVPGASVTTDIIVGFPGETEEDFEDSLDMVRKCQFDGAFTFIFSPRSGTAAAKMPDQVPHDIKSQRLQKLVDIQNEIIRERNQALIGSTVEVLVEEAGNEVPENVTDKGVESSAKRTPECRGRTRTNRLVIALGEAAPGDLIHVQVEEAGTWYLKGPILARASKVGRGSNS